MYFTEEQNPHNDTKIQYLNNYSFVLEELHDKLCQGITFINPKESEELKEELMQDYPEEFSLTLAVEEEMGYTFSDIQIHLILANYAVQKVGERVLKESAEKYGTVYLIGSEDKRILKIGFTRNLEQRLKQLQSGKAYTLTVIKSKPGTLEIERKALEAAKRFNIQGEWFTWDDSIIENFGT